MSLLKPAALALGLSVIAGAALAADQMDCCCKDEDGKMTCCDKRGDKTPTPNEAPKPPATDRDKHQH